MTTAREIMHFGVECIKEDQTLDHAARRMRELHVGSMPICGLLTDGDGGQVARRAGSRAGA